MRTGFTGFTRCSKPRKATSKLNPVHPVHPVFFPLRIVADASPVEIDALLPAILPSSPSYDGTGDRAFNGKLCP